MPAMELSGTVRRIIDSRLDAIERALMANGTPRGDRLQIVSATEDQILEMLNRQGSDEPTREDVLNVLARIDPPEAYLDSRAPETSDFPHHPETESRPRHVPAPESREQPADGIPGAAIAGLILSILLCFVTIGLCFLIPLYGGIPATLFGFALLFLNILAAGICNALALLRITDKRPRQPGFGAVLAAFCCVSVAPLIGLLILLLLMMMFI